MQPAASEAAVAWHPPADAANTSAKRRGCIFVGRTELNIYALGFYICRETRENSRRIVFSQSNGNKPKCIKGNANKYMGLRLCVLCATHTHTHHKKQKERKRKRSVEKSKHVCMGFRVVRTSQPADSLPKV